MDIRKVKISSKDIFNKEIPDGPKYPLNVFTVCQEILLGICTIFYQNKIRMFCAPSWSSCYISVGLNQSVDSLVVALTLVMVQSSVTNQVEYIC